MGSVPHATEHQGSVYSTTSTSGTRAVSRLRRCSMPANPLNTDDFGGELYNLAMSEGARPLLEQVKSFIATEVEPITEEYFRLGTERTERWSFAPGQLELLESVKDK